MSSSVNFRTAPRLNPVRLALVAAPAVEPWAVSDVELSLALRIDGTTDNAYLTAIIRAARQYFEGVTGLALINQTWRAAWDHLPQGRELELTRGPLASVASVKVLDDASAESTVPAGQYALGGVGYPRAFGRVRLRSGYDWPTAGDVPDAVRVEFVAGFGAAAANVPADIRLALLHLVAHWYENRLPLNIGNIVNELPHSLQALIESHRVTCIA